MSEVPRILRERLAFLHIEKTAGTSLIGALSTLFNENELCPARQAVISYWLESDLRKFRFFYAHSNMKDFLAVPEPCQYITVLRNPVERALSYYEFLRYHADNVDHGDPRIRVAQALDVSQFFFLAPEATLDAFSNHMTGCLSSPQRPFNRNSLEHAKENLHKFAVVGVTEYMGLFLRRLAARFDLCELRNLDHLNITHDMLAADHPARTTLVSEAVIGRIKDLNKLDLELYDYVLDHFVKPTTSSRTYRLVIPPMFTRVASSPSCVVAPEGYEGNVLCGPYRRIFPGKWSVAFEVAAECTQAQLHDTVAMLDVYSATQKREFARIAIHGSDLDWPRFKVFSLEVDTDIMIPDIEFRVWKNSCVRLICRDEVTVSERSSMTDTEAAPAAVSPET